MTAPTSHRGRPRKRGNVGAHRTPGRWRRSSGDGTGCRRGPEWQPPGRSVKIGDTTRCRPHCPFSLPTPGEPERCHPKTLPTPSPRAVCGVSGPHSAGHSSPTEFSRACQCGWASSDQLKALGAQSEVSGNGRNFPQDCNLETLPEFPAFRLKTAASTLARASPSNPARALCLLWAVRLREPRRLHLASRPPLSA